MVVSTICGAGPMSKSVYVRGLGEQSNVQFRADFFNPFNTPWFSNPNTAIGAATQRLITT